MSRGYRFEVVQGKGKVHIRVLAPNNEIVLSGEVQSHAQDAFETITNMVFDIENNGIRYTVKSLKP